jgi:KaiC/GvpD/RAD55 family RecA-like ATPase
MLKTDKYYGEDEAKNHLINDSFTNNICKNNKSGTFLLELPSDDYFVASSASVKCLTEKGYKGIYLSFQRPFENIYNLFDKYEINNDNVVIIDCANSKEDFVNISSFDNDKLCKKITDGLKELKGEKKFVFIDSLTTIALYKKESEIKKLAKTLIELKNSKHFDNLLILFNVSEELSSKRFVKDISSYADDTINVSDSNKKYSRDVIKPGVCT